MTENRTVAGFLLDGSLVYLTGSASVDISNQDLVSLLSKMDYGEEERVFSPRGSKLRPFTVTVRLFYQDGEVFVDEVAVDD